MQSVNVRLSTLSKIQAFVNLMNRFPFAISLRQGRSVIDAKSILGIYSLDLTKPITVDIYSNQPGELVDELVPYGK